MKSRGTFIAVLLVLMQSLLYGFGDPISKVAFKMVPVFSILTVRYWIAFVFLMLVFGKRVVQQLRSCGWKKLIMPALCIALAYLLSNVALSVTSATTVAFLRSTSTILTPILALLVFDRRYSRKHVPILAAVLVGLYLLCKPGDIFYFGIGEVLTLISALLIAGSLVFAEDSLVHIDALTITTVQTFASAVLTTVCALIIDGGVDLSHARKTAWFTILYLALTCTVGGYLLQNYALRVISSSTVALLQCMHPVMTTVFSFIILREELGVGGLVGALIIILCVIADNIVSAREKKR